MEPKLLNKDDHTPSRGSFSIGKCDIRGYTCVLVETQHHTQETPFKLREMANITVRITSDGTPVTRKRMIFDKGEIKAIAKWYMETEDFNGVAQTLHDALMSKSKKTKSK